MICAAQFVIKTEAVRKAIQPDIEEKKQKS